MPPLISIRYPAVYRTIGTKAFRFPRERQSRPFLTCKGVMRHVDFQTEGETYSELKTFYTTELRAAGYNVGKPVEQPALKTIDIMFSACGKLDTVSIFPDQENPKDFSVRVVYDTYRTTNKTGTSSPVLSLYVNCSFGDVDACNQFRTRDPVVRMLMLSTTL